MADMAPCRFTEEQVAIMVELLKSSLAVLNYGADADLFDLNSKPGEPSVANTGVRLRAAIEAACPLFGFSVTFGDSPQKGKRRKGGRR